MDELKIHGEYEKEKKETSFLENMILILKEKIKNKSDKLLHQVEYLVCNHFAYINFFILAWN